MTDGRPYKPLKYREVIEKMLIITILSEHSISYSDIDNMPLLDRDYIYEKLKERQEYIAKQREEIRARQASQRKK